MEIKNIKISELHYADYNPRKISEGQFKRLRQSIKEFGFVEPAIVNSYPGRENVIVGGHMRVRAAQAEGYTEVPCYLVSLEPPREKILNLALNRISGEWDEDKLAELIYGLNEEEQDLRLTGFEELQIKTLLEDGMLGAPRELDSMELPMGEKNGFQQITFTLTDGQAELVKNCVKAAKKGEPGETGNENSNGNAIAKICEEWEKQRK